MARMTSQAQARVDDLMKHWLDDPESDEVFTVEHITDADYPPVPVPDEFATRGDLDTLAQLRDQIEYAECRTKAILREAERGIVHEISELGELL